MYDGQRRPKLWQQAEEFLGLASLQHELVYNLRTADVAVQEDDWSCGQRVLSTLHCILARCARGQLRWPPVLPAELRAAAALQKVCEPDRTPVKEQPPPLPVSYGDTAEQHFGPLVVEPSVEPGLVEDDGSQEELENAAEQKEQQPKKKKKPKPDMRSIGLRRANELGIDFEKIFECAHAAAKCPLAKGHWQQFLVQLARGNVMRCRVRSELRDFKEKERESQAALLPLDPPPSEDAPALATDTVPALPRKRGRPRKTLRQLTAEV